MRLTTFTDYALRTLLYLASHGPRLATISEIARSHAMPVNHLSKVVYHLGACGVLRTVRGRHGGVALARPPSEIRIGAVVRSSEPDFKMVDCFDRDHASCCYAGHCQVQDALGRATDAYLATLDKITLADLLPQAAQAA